MPAVARAGRRQRRRECPHRPATITLLPSLHEEPHQGRPRTRGECKYGPRPCPWVTCEWHLYAEIPRVARDGVIRLTWPNLEPWELPETCALDVADRGGMTLEEVGGILNLTRERVRQIQHLALMRIKARMRRAR